MAPRFLAVVAAAFACAAFPAAASAAFGPISSFGSFGEEAGQFTEGGLAIGPSGDFYVGDFRNARVDQFGPDGTFIRAFGAGVDHETGGNVCTAATRCQAGNEGGSAGEFAEMEGIATGPTGDVYTVSWASNRVEVFTAEGQFVRAFGEGVLDGSHEPQVCTTTCVAGLPGTGAGEMYSPYGIGVDPASGDLYVSDTGNDRIDVYQPDGTFLKAFGKKVNLTDESDVCTEASGCQEGDESGVAGAISGAGGVAFAPGSGDVYVAEYDAARVEQFTPSGEFVRAFGKKVNLTDESDVCTEASGCRDGEYSSVAGALEDPLWEAFDAAGNLYIADNQNSRVDVYSAEGEFERAFGGGVIDGAEEFQVCTVETGCMEGSGESGPGSVMHPYGIAVVNPGECNGLPGVYVLGEHFTSPPPPEARIGRFGEPAPANTCPPPPLKEEKHETKSPPSNKVTLGKLKLDKKRGTALLAVSVPGPGSLALSGKGVRGQRLHVPGQTSVNLPVALGGKARKKLVKTGKARVTVTVAFTPDGGTDAGHASETVTLKKLKKRR